MGKVAEKVINLPPYPFAEIDEKVRQLREEGVNVIDMGVGDPVSFDVPSFVREAAVNYIQEHPKAGYPSYEGAPWFREAVAQWFESRFGVKLDPHTQIAVAIGAKEAIFNFHHAVIDPSDVVLCPSPGYPPYSRGAIFADGEPVFYPVSKHSGYFPDVGMISPTLLNRTRLLWITQPHAPTGRVYTINELRQIYEFAQKWGFIVASDEAYSEIWFGSPPHSMLEVSTEGVIVFHSLSKRSAMTGYRIGFVAGDPELISAFKKVKMNVDSGAPEFIQAAAVAALSDEKHVSAMRSQYQKRMQAMVDAFAEIGFPVRRPEATIFLWQEVSPNLGVELFMEKLLSPAVGVVGIPGKLLAENLLDGTNPGRDFVRFALTPSTAKVEEAARRIQRAFKRF